MPDGHLNKCKECTKRDVKLNYESKREQYSQYERDRFKRPERKAQILDSQRNRRVKFPEKEAAYRKVNRALKSGKLTKLPCEVCGTEVKVQAHHHDYFKPLDVRWLCFTCHREEHGQVVVSEWAKKKTG